MLFLIYAWHRKHSADINFARHNLQHLHWSIPMMSGLFSGFGIFHTFQSCLTYLGDVYQSGLWFLLVIFCSQLTSKGSVRRECICSSPSSKISHRFRLSSGYKTYDPGSWGRRYFFSTWRNCHTADSNTVLVLQVRAFSLRLVRISENWSLSIRYGKRIRKRSKFAF